MLQQLISRMPFWVLYVCLILMLTILVSSAASLFQGFAMLVDFNIDRVVVCMGALFADCLAITALYWFIAQYSEG